MDEEQNRTPLVTGLLRSFATVFSVSVLVMSLAGILISRFAPEVQDMSALFILGRAGFPYKAVLQLAGFAVIMAVYITLIFSRRFFIKIRFVGKAVIMLIVTLLTISVFAVIFKWFPANDPLTWISFILSFVISFAVAISLTLLKLKLEEKKYNKLLANYKERRQER